MRIRTWLGNVVAFITADFLAAHHAEAKNDQKIREGRGEASEDDKRILAGLEAVRQHYKEDQERRKSIEDKAKTALVGITTATSIVFVGLSYTCGGSTLARQHCFWRVLHTLALSGAMVYYMLGTVSALRALAIRPIHVLDLEHEASGSEEYKVRILLSCLDRNRLVTVTRSNYAHASMVCLRNGTFLLLVFIILTFVLTVLGVGTMRIEPAVPGSLYCRKRGDMTDVSIAPEIRLGSSPFLGVESSGICWQQSSCVPNYGQNPGHPHGRWFIHCGPKSLREPPTNSGWVLSDYLSEGLLVVFVGTAASDESAILREPT